MSTVAYCAVSPEGGTDGRQILLRDEAVAGLRRLTDAIHAEARPPQPSSATRDPLPTRPGRRCRASRRRGCSARCACASRAPSPPRTSPASPPTSPAQRAWRSGGFDALEIHLGHNYLLSAFLSPKLNTRTDQWGGSLENRAPLPRQVVRAVREAVGDRVAVTAKLNMADGVPGGFWLDESLAFARLLETDGALDALELTGGSSLANPMYLFRGEAPIHEMAAVMPPAVRLMFRVVARRMMPEYPSRRRSSSPTPGVSRRAHDAAHPPRGHHATRHHRARARGGLRFVAMARALLREPDLIGRMRSGAASESLCVHCNKCMPTIYSGTRCVLVSPGARVQAPTNQHTVAVDA